jgi:hypothetical protein
LEGEEQYTFGLLNEVFIDPGHMCYNPGCIGNQADPEKEEDDCEHNEDIKVSVSEPPDLSTVGTYVVTYHCVNFAGTYAFPAKRTVIVDRTKKDQLQTTQVSMQLAGLSKRETGDVEQRDLMGATARTFAACKGIGPAKKRCQRQWQDLLSIQSVADCNPAQAREIGVGSGDKCLRVLFEMSCVQDALMQELRARIDEIRFDDDIKAALVKEAKAGTSSKKLESGEGPISDLVKGLKTEPQVVIIRNPTHHT